MTLRTPPPPEPPTVRRSGCSPRFTSSPSDLDPAGDHANRVRSVSLQRHPRLQRRTAHTARRLRRHRSAHALRLTDARRRHRQFGARLPDAGFARHRLPHFTVLRCQPLCRPLCLSPRQRAPHDPLQYLPLTATQSPWRLPSASFARAVVPSLSPHGLLFLTACRGFGSHTCRS